eukprot:6452716-Alexandrium_andersonii.AAC.1
MIEVLGGDGRRVATGGSAGAPCTCSGAACCTSGILVLWESYWCGGSSVPVDGAVRRAVHVIA